MDMISHLIEVETLPEMITHSIQLSVPYSCLLCFIMLILLPSAKPAPLPNTVIYKSCAAQTFPFSSSQAYTQTLSSLFGHLIAQSTQTKFFQSVEIGSEDTALSGLFQCRGDITKEDCYNCVNMLPQIANSLCGDSLAARIQLHGCYAHYEADGFSLSDITEDARAESRLKHKTCGEPTESSTYLKELLAAALVELETGVISGNGFYSTDYESVQVMGQCEGDVEGCDCGECISEAVQVAQEECIGSVSGEIYFDKCFMTYSYRQNSGQGTGGRNTGRSAAIIIGGAVAAALVVVFYLSIKSRCEKDGD